MIPTRRKVQTKSYTNWLNCVNEKLIIGWVIYNFFFFVLLCINIIVYNYLSII